MITEDQSYALLLEQVDLVQEQIKLLTVDAVTVSVRSDQIQRLWYADYDGAATIGVAFKAPSILMEGKTKDIFKPLVEAPIQIVLEAVIAHLDTLVGACLQTHKLNLAGISAAIGQINKTSNRIGSAEKIEAK